MKTFLAGIAIVLVCTFFTVFSQDYMVNQRQNFKLKYVADELSASGSMFFNLMEYAEGYIIFDEIEGLKAISKQVQDLLYLNDSYSPLKNSYWNEKIVWSAYFFDDTEVCRIYTNNRLVEQKPFAYPYLFEEQATGFTTVITEPTVIVTINAGKARYRLPIFKDIQPTIRSSAHEWSGY